MFNDGLPILANSLKKITSVKLAKTVKKIISIENKTNFIEEKYNANILYIYTHGFPSLKELEFMNMILRLNSGVQMYHFSDIDLGGFRIFEYLQKHLNCHLKVFKMGVSELILYRQYCEEISEEYICKLKKINLPEFNEVIQYMITNKIRLEQEALLIE